MSTAEAWEVFCEKIQNGFWELKEKKKHMKEIIYNYAIYKQII